MKNNYMITMAVLFIIGISVFSTLIIMDFTEGNEVKEQLTYTHYIIDQDYWGTCSKEYGNVGIDGEVIDGEC